MVLRLRRTLVLLAVALAAAPALAYTIYLKDGSKLVAREKWVVQGDKAIIVLPSGAQSMIDFAEIDIERTEEANQSKLSGTATVIEGGREKEFREKEPPPPPKPTLQDMIRSKEAQFKVEPNTAPLSSLPRAGSTISNRRDEVKRAPFPDADIATDILAFAGARGVSALGVYRGQNARQPLLVYEVASEGSVFKALVVSANALIHMNSARPGAVDAFEVECETAAGSPGGKFVLTPQLAADLVSGRYEITRFYVENVIF